MPCSPDPADRAASRSSCSRSVTSRAAGSGSPVRSGLDYILAQQEPFPAVVVDRRWSLLKANAGAVPGRPLGSRRCGQSGRCAGRAGRPAPVPGELGGRGPLLHAQVEADAAADGTAETAALLHRLLAYAGVARVAQRISLEPTSAPVLPMHFRKGEVSLTLFTTIATLGTPQDVTLHELRIECFFPLDEPTADVFRSWAAGQQKRAPASHRER